MTGILIRSPERITRDWARAVLRHAGIDASVACVERVSVDVGTTTRVRLVVEHDGPEECPRRWFVKLPSSSLRARAITALPRLPQTEVRFYAELSGAVPVHHPRGLAAASRPGRGTTLVLADVEEAGGRLGTPGQALGVDEAGLVVDALARLHARFFESPELEGRLAWLSGPVRRLEDALGSALAVRLMRRGLERAQDAVPDRLHSGALEYARNRRRASRLLAEAPRTLVHHDCHPANLYWLPGEAGLLDWQLVRVGEGVGDVAYLLATALDPPTRRASEAKLLKRYAEAFAAAGGPAFEPAALERRYCAHTVYAFEAMVVTLAIGGLMPEPVARELVGRTSAAVDDARGFEALGEGFAR